MFENHRLIEKRTWSLLLPCCIAIFLGFAARDFSGEFFSNILFFDGVGIACCYILTAGILDMVRGKL